VRLAVLLPGVLALAFVAGASSVKAQPGGKVYRVGHVTSGTRDQSAQILRALEDGLRHLGYVDGQNLRIEHRFADGQAERLPTLVAELVRLNVDAIVAGSNQTIAVAKRATTTIPIIMTTTADPVGAGFVASLARPGGNITGLAIDVTPDIAGKRLALLKEAVPTVSRVAVLWEPTLSWSPGYWQATQRAAGPLRLALRSFELRQAGPDLDAAFERIAREGTDSLFVFLSSLTVRRAADITAFARQHRLPAVYGARIFAEHSGLLSYGPDLVDSYRRAATYLDKVFRGTTPADLPVEQPTKFELVINLKTAKALGLTIPPAVLARADEVIQ
jgi:putative ABC transport system substrate-binding protein